MSMAVASRRSLLAALAAVPLAARRRALLQGTFLQLSGDLAAWDPAKWIEAFGYFRRLKLQEYVIQWSASGEEGVLPAVSTIAAQAARSGSRVWAGLSFDHEYWRRLEGPDTELATYLDTIVRRSTALVKSLRNAAKPHGWYIPQEVDDLNWRTAARRAMLLDFLRRVSPKGRVAISAFRGGTVWDNEFASLWRTVARETPVRTLFLQDGVGTGKSTIGEAAQHRAQLSRGGLDVRGVVELFEQTSPPGAPFAAHPAPAQRIQRQLDAAGEGAIAFSVPEYMTPLGGPEAARLYEQALALGW